MTACHHPEATLPVSVAKHRYDPLTFVLANRENQLAQKTAGQEKVTSQYRASCPALVEVSLVVDSFHDP